MDYTKLTIKHFISDLPRIINKNFEVIKSLLSEFVDESVSGTITLKGTANTTLNGEFGRVNTSTLKARSIIFVEDGREYTLKDYINKCIEEAAEEN